MGELAQIDEELLPHRQVEAELVAQHRQPGGIDAVLPHPHLDGVARHEPDRHEDEEDEGDEGRDGEEDAFDEEADHGHVARWRAAWTR